ncbi:MAG: hypothetical protein ACFFAY_13575 [Promethearchaeota archaeon]
MVSDELEESVFEDYRELDSKTTSTEQYIVAFLHVIAAIFISLIGFNAGLAAWFAGFGILTPILLVVLGAFYANIRSPEWHRDQMVPFILEFTTVTDIEIEQYVRFHQKQIRYTLILGWGVLLFCQLLWTIGFTVVMPIFISEYFIVQLVGEFVGYAVIFGPFFLYVVLLFVISGKVELLLKARNEEISRMIEIESKWYKESARREKPSESVQNEDDDSSIDEISRNVKAKKWRLY